MPYVWNHLLSCHYISHRKIYLSHRKVVGNFFRTALILAVIRKLSSVTKKNLYYFSHFFLMGLNQNKLNATAFQIQFYFDFIIQIAFQILIFHNQQILNESLSLILYFYFMHLPEIYCVSFAYFIYMSIIQHYMKTSLKMIRMQT